LCLQPAEFEAALLEKGVSFEQLEDNFAQFEVAEDVNQEHERHQFAICVYLNDDYVTDEAVRRNAGGAI
jgi:hypothetical protein